MPKDAILILRFNIEQGKKSALFAKYKDEIVKSLAEPLSEMKAKCQFDPLEVGEELLLGVDDMAQTDAFIMVGKGAVTKEQVTKCITQMTSAAGDANANTDEPADAKTNVTIEEDAETKIVTIKGDEEPAFLYWPGKHTVVMSTNLEKLKASIQSAKDNKAPAVASNPNFSKAMAKYDSNATLSVMGAFDEEFGENLKKLNPMFGFVPAMPRILGVNITASEALGIVVDLGFASEEEAKKIAGLIALAPNLGVPEEDKDLVEAIKSEQVGSEVKVSLDLTNAQIDRLVNQAKAAQGKVGQ